MTWLLQFWIPALAIAFFVIYYLAPRIGLDLGLREFVQGWKTQSTAVVLAVASALDGFNVATLVPEGQNPAWFILGVGLFLSWVSRNTKRSE